MTEKTTPHYTDSVARLAHILDLETLDTGLYRGTGAGGETMGRIFGGQVIAQALQAAYKTVSDRDCHSLHAYFMRPGDPKSPVIYKVDDSRDGRSFTTRRVVAQQHGEQILVLNSSFHVQEDGPDHQHLIPEAMPDPDFLPSRSEKLAKMGTKMPHDIRETLLHESPIDVREVTASDLLTPVHSSAKNMIWFRLRRPLAGPLALHHCCLAYASDFCLLPSALRPLAEGTLWGNFMTASLDHAMWFHRATDFSNWHLYVMDSPSTCGARGFTRGTIFDASGELVASTAQEGLVRPMQPRKSATD